MGDEPEQFDRIEDRPDRMNKVVATVTGVASSPAVGVVVGPRAVYVAAPGEVAVVDHETAQVTDRIVAMDTTF